MSLLSKAKWGRDHKQTNQPTNKQTIFSRAPYWKSKVICYTQNMISAISPNL